ncbi:MAG: putative heme d1 biosynthesis radical SAM protein NirJ1 [Terrimicrobiaceae bacterium]
MINLTRLYLNESQPADGLRYGVGHGRPFATAAERHPVVVWNITRRCNLRCVHCYSDSEPRFYAGELDIRECKKVIDDLAGFGVPAVLLSGGEPLTHPDFFTIARYASERGLRLTLSTNGTLLRKATAYSIRQIGFSYVGISLDGIGDVHDRFRGHKGAFDRAVQAFRNCREVGQKAGLRLTLTSHTIDSLPQVLDFIEDEDVRRVCFYHLVFSGRGAGLQLVDPDRLRNAIDTILERIRQWHACGVHREVLTVDQPADAAYLYLKLREENPARAEDVLSLMEWNGGGANSSGVGIANIDSAGNVHPDQFWQTHTLGNVREKPFSEIWTTSDDALLSGLRDRIPRLRGRCASCRFVRICGGGFRVRAAQMHNDPWAEDPGCYLRDDEILVS